MWGEICQLFSSALHQHRERKKKETRQHRLVETGTEIVDMDALLWADL